MRTSLTHPLKIAEIRPFAGFGRIGITFCPGKVQPDAMTGGWQRDLGRDLDAIARWNAASVVTLIEDHEMQALQVPDLGAQVRARHMQWHHLPIPDMHPPDAAFERLWTRTGATLRAQLRGGSDVLVHCKGGLGRAGTIAARLLIELGHDHRAAVEQVRSVRPGAIETAAQEAHLASVQAIPEPKP